tara:strand:+ start:986 stop:1765 length:780 start_codon:yes stop_codon:yes gene_type:complete
MLRQALRHTTTFLILTILIAGAIWGAHESAQKSIALPSETEIMEITNVGSLLSASQQAAVIRSRASAVQVVSMDLEDGGLSLSSGTYVTFQNRFFILTTSHGVGNICALTQIVVDGILYDCKGYVLRDPQTDYIVIQIEEIPDITPVDIVRHTPRRAQWKRDLATQNTIFYTGFPNEGGPYTFDGKIVGYVAEEAIFVDSYGWSGSSGAGVFSAQGHLIGWVMALEVGETYFGRQVLENFMWVIPLFNINWDAVGAFAN